jgi:beta-1,4-mannosyl-glycoprotein beta-1,4-N-acetylglucosaminyltransferase
MIYDCFLFNTELDLLQLRLSFLNDVADYFVIVESKRTLSGEPKRLHYQENKALFKKYHHKIIHLEAPLMPALSAWEYEYFQRNYIKEGLKECNGSDLILISDVDEIINLKSILSIPGLQLPALIELPYYYFFFNLKAHKSFAVNLLCEYSFLKDLYIGERNETYKKYVKHVITKEACKTGWHFSYLFGFDITKYQEKISSFSHQEYNTPYFQDEQRILTCIRAGVDLFERDNIFFSFKDPRKDLPQLMPFIEELNMMHLIYKAGWKTFLKKDVLRFVLQKKVGPYLKYKLYVLPKYKVIVASSPARKKIRKAITKIWGRK